MTDAAYKPDTQATLWVTDAEMIRRMGVPEISAASLKSLSE